MEIESSIACYLEVRMTLVNKRGVLQLANVGEVQIRIRDGSTKQEAYLDVTEQVLKNKEVMHVLESIGLDVFDGQGGERKYQANRKSSKQFKSFKE